MEDNSIKINDDNLKKRYIRAGISAVFICLMVIIGYIFLARATKRDSSDFKYRPFFEEDTDYDVMFFGTSHVINGIFPMQLWNDYGITSYNFGGHGSTIAASYWTMINVTNRNKPKVAVLDIFGADQQVTEMNLSHFHVSTDAFPLDYIKIQAVKDIFPDDKDSQEEILFPFSIYHNRWNEMDRDSVKRGFGIGIKSTVEKGAESRIQVAMPDKTEVISESEYIDEKSIGLIYIRKFVEYCKKNGIEPVIINIPYPANEKDQVWANTAINLAKDLNVTALNMQYGEIVDFNVDCYDPVLGAHLNPSGARKVTDYLGKVLTEKFDLEDKRENEKYEDWNKAYGEYYDFLETNIKNYNDYKTTLMLLNNSNFKADIVTKLDYTPDKVEEKLMDQLGNKLTVREAQYIATDSGENVDIKITVYNKQTGNKVVTKFYNISDSVEYIENIV